MSTKTIESARKARSVNDLKKLLTSISKSVDSSSSLVNSLLRSSKRRLKISVTCSGDEEIKIDHTGTGKVSRVKLTQDTDSNAKQQLSSFKPPKVTNVKEHSEVINQLYDNSLELDSIESFLTQSFEGMKGQPAALKGVRELQKTVDATLEKAFSSLNQVAASSLPPEVKAFGDSLTEYLIDSLDKESYDNILNSVYVTYGKDLVWHYSYYVTIENLKNEGGYTFDDYNIVLSVLIDKSKKAQYYLTTLADFRIPGKFPLGKAISSTKEMKSALGIMLRHNDVISVLDKRHLPIDDSHAKKLVSIPGIKDATVDEDTLIIKLSKKNASATEVNAVKTAVLPILNSLVGNKSKRSVITSKLVKDATGSEIHFILVPTHREPSGINTEKLYDLQYALDLSDDELDNIKAALKHR